VSKTLFISKNIAELGELRTYSDLHELQLISTSFLEFLPISFTLTESYDVIFFGSPRAVMFFKANGDIPKSKLIASVGEKTMRLLESMGHEVAFSGKANHSISEVADDFKDWLKDRKALFPISSRSLGTISKSIPARQKVLIECYETKVSGKEIPPCDYYVFTSPSNVEGFFQKNKLPEKSIVVAWGESTAASIQKAGAAYDGVLQEPSIECLIDYLQKFSA